ncbi:MAG: restriction endonuclease subunit S [Deltaproteobacteria bacterium]
MRKDKWKPVKLGNVFKLKSGNALPVSKHIEGNIPVYGGNGIMGYHNALMINKPTISIGRVGTPGAVYITKEKAWITDNALYPIEYYEEVDQYFLAELLRNLRIDKLAQKTAQPSISQTIISNIDTILPPLEEQKQIAALFQSTETAMEQVDGQEKNLLQFKNKLLRDLFSDKKEFGNHLTAKDFETVRFDKIAINISERVEPKKTELTTYVGLEHLDSDNLVIERTGIPDDVIGTKLKIYKGDIIFGKRRAYLRKVAVSHFDGIASAHSMILRANEKHIEKDFLPFFMQSDAFMQRAVQISEGSLSPTIKVKTLAQQEFTLPKKEKQKELVALFKQLDETRQQLKQQKATLKLLKQKLLNEILG